MPFDGSEVSAAGAATIRVDGLKKTFGDGEEAVRAVDDVSFSVEPGSIVGLLGPNGAGKTTTIKSLLGLVLPDAGTVEVAGIDVGEEPSRAYLRIGAMLEGARNVYWRLTVRENLRFFAGLGGDHPSSLSTRHDRLLEGLGLADRADTPVNDLSRGMKQKVSLASTLARDVDVVFLDEPTLGLDIETSLELRAELRRLAEREEMSIIVSSHDMDVIEDVCDRVIILHDGRVIADEAVDELIELFRTQTYRLRVDGAVPTAVQSQLEHELGASCRRDGSTTTIELTAEESDPVYELVAALREAELSLRGIESVEPDLEEVFLRLTDEGSLANAANRSTDKRGPSEPSSPKGGPVDHPSGVEEAPSRDDR